MWFILGYHTLTKIFFKFEIMHVLRWSLMIMNIWATIWPYFGRFRPKTKIQQKMAEIQHLFKICLKPKISSQNKYEHEPHKCPQKSHPNHATSSKTELKLPKNPFLPLYCALISDFDPGKKLFFFCFQNLLKTLNLWFKT